MKNQSAESCFVLWVAVLGAEEMSHHLLQGRDYIIDEDLYAAMENKAMESFSEMTGSPKPGQDDGVPNPIPSSLRRAVAVYEAGKVLMAYITPDFEEVARVSKENHPDG